MEVYAAMVDQMDQGIGRLVETLKARGQLDNTLIFFLQDNGGCAENGGRGDKPFPRPDKPTFAPIPDDVIHYTSSTPKQTRDGYPVRRGHVMPGPEDTYIGYGRNWANVSNTPFREYKHWVHEGGVSTPLIAHWPKGISAKNELRRHPSHLIDLMATCIDVSGAEYPKQVGGKAIKPMEGHSLAPAFAGKALDREAIYWEHEGNRAIRVGDWKLVAKGRNGKWELYDLSKDRVEMNDLSKVEPKRAMELQAMWQVYAERADVIPWPNSNKSKNKAKGQRKNRKTKKK
jgi:arylsulfatase